MSDTELSPSGRVRREQILEMAIQHARQRRHRRLAVRSGAVAIALLAIAAGVFSLQHTTLHPSETLDSVIPPPAAPTLRHVPATQVVIERIQTDPTIVRRLAVPQSRPRWQRLDDDHLLQELAQAGRPAGLVKIGGQETLVFHRVVP